MYCFMRFSVLNKKKPIIILFYMLGVSFFYFFQNIFFITIIFWLLSFVGDKFFIEKNSKYSEEVFECGFFSTSTVNLSFNFNFFIICSLLILYDIELVFLAPFLFNYNWASSISILIFNCFYTLIVLSFIIDWEFISIEWSI